MRETNPPIDEQRDALWGSLMQWHRLVLLRGHADGIADVEAVPWQARALAAFDEVVQPELERMAEMERVGNELAHHLNQLNSEQYERRYGPDGPCTGCYEAVAAWRELVPTPALVAPVHPQPAEIEETP